MSKPYDAATKFLVESQPEAWPAYVGLPVAPARIIDADISQARELWAGTYVLMGMEYTPEVSGQLLKGVLGMEETMTYQYILARGEALGELRGKAEEARSIILQLGNQRLGVPDASVQAAISNTASQERLDQLIKRLLQVETWDELLA